MARARLYVKSKRTTVVTGHVIIETIGAAHTTSEYSEGSILAKLPRQDALAKDLLKKSGLKFDLVDLSNGIGTRLGARLKGVTQTPTLIDGNSPSRSYIGVREISRYIASDRTVEEN